jgi:NAD-dependent epimerase/dehydratase family protein
MGARGLMTGGAGFIGSHLADELFGRLPCAAARRLGRPGPRRRRGSAGLSGARGRARARRPGEAHGIATTALRFLNVYGTRQALSNPHTGVLAIFAARLLNGRRPLLFGDGEQRRDFVDVPDVALRAAPGGARGAADRKVCDMRFAFIMIGSGYDDERAARAWCQELRAQGVWGNEPVPLFPYPGSPDHGRLLGPPDDRTWERAHAHYLAQFDAFSDLQDEQPRPLAELERGCTCP